MVSTLFLYGVTVQPGVTADFVPPPILSPRTKSASGYCPPGQYPLADIVPPSPNLSPPQQLLFKLCFPLTQLIQRRDKTRVCAFCENLFISSLQLLTKLMQQKTLLTLQKSRKLLFVLSASEKLFNVGSYLKEIYCLE